MSTLIITARLRRPRDRLYKINYLYSSRYCQTPFPRTGHCSRMYTSHNGYKNLSHHIQFFIAVVVSSSNKLYCTTSWGLRLTSVNLRKRRTKMLEKINYIAALFGRWTIQHKNNFYFEPVVHGIYAFKQTISNISKYI